jgi:hypothetical protein
MNLESEVRMETDQSKMILLDEEDAEFVNEGLMEKPEL